MIDQEKNDAEELRRQVVSNIYLFFFFLGKFCLSLCKCDDDASN